MWPGISTRNARSDGLPIRYEDNQRCIEVILQEACAKPECLGVILTGDTFHRKTLLPKYQIQLQQMARRLHSAGKEFFAIDGNHDGSDASWLDTVSPEINANGRLLKPGGVTAAFLSFQPREKLYEKIKQLPDNTRCLFPHGRLLELMAWAAHQQEPEYDLSAQELRELGLKNCTVFLGDLHTYSDYHDPVGNNWFVYSGSTEMTEISEGNVISDRFGGRYDTVKKCLRFLSRPGAWQELGDDGSAEPPLPETCDWSGGGPGFGDSIRQPMGGVSLARNPRAALSGKPAGGLKQPLALWRQKLLVFFEVPLSRGMARPLQDMKETDILEIAQGELTERQLQILAVVLTQDPFDKPLSSLVRVAAKPA